MSVLSNLLDEMKYYNLSYLDILFIGSLHNGYGCTYNEFKVLAADTDTTSDDLVVVFSNHMYFRRENDEWVYTDSIGNVLEQLPMLTLGRSGVSLITSNRYEYEKDTGLDEYGLPKEKAPLDFIAALLNN